MTSEERDLLAAEMLERLPEDDPSSGLAVASALFVSAVLAYRADFEAMLRLACIQHATLAAGVKAEEAAADTCTCGLGYAH